MIKLLLALTIGGAGLIVVTALLYKLIQIKPQVKNIVLNILY